VRQNPVDGRLIRRGLVILTALLWLLLVATLPHSLDGFGMPLALALLTLDVILGALTGWLAFARGASLDERQAAVRDRGYRVAFRLLLLGALVMIVAVFVGSVIDSFNGFYSQPQPQPVLSARWIVALIELFLALPTIVIAWNPPDPLEPRRIATGGIWIEPRWIPLLIVPGLAAFWLLAIGSMPVRAGIIPENSGSVFGGVANATCKHFRAGRDVGYGFGAQVRLDVEACWDGKHAFAFRLDPMTDLTRCEVPAGTADFARVTHLSCTESADASGTMHYTVHATVEPLLAPGVKRDVVMELDVTRDGKVLAFG
jgi:hypothetical protein